MYDQKKSLYWFGHDSIWSWLVTGQLFVKKKVVGFLTEMRIENIISQTYSAKEKEDFYQFDQLQTSRG